MGEVKKGVGNLLDTKTPKNIDKTNGRLFMSVKMSDKKKILDIGSGNSNFVENIKGDITTFDINSKYKPDIVGDICTYDFKGERFDLVIGHFVLKMINKDVEKAIENIASITDRCIFYEPLYFNENKFRKRKTDKGVFAKNILYYLCKYFYVKVEYGVMCDKKNTVNRIVCKK